MRQTSQIILAILALALLVPALIWVPSLFPPDPSLPNVAAQRGYNIGLAWIVIFLWSVAVILVASLTSTRTNVQPQAPSASPTIPALQRWAERLVVMVPPILLAWPAAIARFGPHVEDAYFLAALHRISCGQVPYRDFEFLYGPLMIAPADVLMGSEFSPVAYYGLYAGLQALLLFVVMILLQRLVPQTGKRWAVFLLLWPFWIDVLLGLNWIGWRYLAALAAIVLLARNPRRSGTLVLAGAMLGVGAAYSHEYAIAGLISALAILALDGWDHPRAMVMRMGTVTLVALTGWFIAAFWALGGDLSAYLELTAQVMSRASQEGLGQFAFGWSLHTLALFALLAAACVATGAGLKQIPQRQAQEGDLLLLGAGVFAVITLKIALQRADFLHMAVPFVPLILIWLAARPAALFQISPALQRFGIAVIVVASVSQLIGHLPLGRWVIPSNARGLYHEITSRPQVGTIPARGPSTQTLRSQVQPNRMALAARLAESDIATRPVLFYGELWTHASETGTCPAGFSFYDILYSDALSPLAETAETEGLIVAINADDYAALQSETTASEPPHNERRILSWIIGETASQSAQENGIEFRMWKQALGDVLVADFVILDKLGHILLLERRS